MSVLLQHRALRILWQLPVTYYFALLWGLSRCWEYTLIFLILWPLPTLTPAYVLKIHIHATCSHSTALHYTILLWAPVGAVRLPLSNVWCVTSLGVSYPLLPQVHELLEGMGFVCLSSVRSPAQDLWLWILVEWMFKPSFIDSKCLKQCDAKSSFSWKSEVVLQCVVLVWGQTLGCALYGVSMMWGMVYLNLCVHSFPQKGPLTQGTWIHALDVDDCFKIYFLTSFSGRKFPRFWTVPTLEEWIGHCFLL